MPRRVRKNTSATTDWDSFGFDLQRSGFNPVESTVGVNNVGTMQKLWSFNVGYNMVHEPVLAYGVSVNSQSTNILYAGSADGSAMYAINASTGAVLWEHTVSYSSYRCANQKLQFSIGETPAIDRGKGLLYFSDGHNDVHAVSLATGKEASGWPLRIADYLHDHNFMHGGLTYNSSNGLLYAVTGSTCDISPWYGRIVAITTTGPSVAGTFYPLSGSSQQGQSGGGIWGPGGASIDPSTNDVFIATGNADTTMGAQQDSGYAEQVIELSATLGTIIASNYPPNIPIIKGDMDFDFGATPLIFTPNGCPEMLAAVNKSGMFELYDVSSISSGPIQYIAMSIPSTKGDFVGVPAYDPVTGYVYIGLPATEGIYHPGLAAFSIQSNCTLNPTPVWSADFGPDGARLSGAQTPRSPISVANGVVYVSNYSLKTEYAFDAATGTQLWSTALSEYGTVGTVIANGVVYVGARDGTITAWAPPGSKSRKRNLQTR
ncbi:MAG TPA: PQQ-binding-like beta-propeller repeat protein [Candidatus Cybelea sp.]|nr:PQQ-binding-like beta-propeller repeat protein [Candidatus Cybelea sp.]